MARLVGSELFMGLGFLLVSIDGSIACFLGVIVSPDVEFESSSTFESNVFIMDHL
jgi:hypothetical protein